MMNKTVHELRDSFRQLRLSEAAKELSQLLRINHTIWISKEWSKKPYKKKEMGCYPFVKSLDVFELKGQKLTARGLSQLPELSWLERQYTLILRGLLLHWKAYIAIGLGIEAVYKGFNAYFSIIGELVQILKLEEYLNKSKVQLKRIRNASLVIIDDLMYMAMALREANLFFHLINHLYERISIILTSNKSPDEWGNLIGDQEITTAILNRLLYRVEVIHGGEEEESQRMKNRKSIFSAEV